MGSIFGLSIIDLLVILVYFAVVLLIGFWASRNVKGQEDYFLAGRKFGKLVQTFATFGTATSPDSAVAVSTTTFTNGASGMWSSLLYLFGLPLHWFAPLWLRRLRILTMGDYFINRYGSVRMGGLYALIGALGLMASMGVGFSAMAKAILAMTPKPVASYNQADIQEYRRAYTIELAQRGPDAESQLLSLEELGELARLEQLPLSQRHEADAASIAVLRQQRPAASISHFSQEVLIWSVCIIVVIYCVAGGLEAAFITDLIQGMFILALSVLLLPAAWAKINTFYGGQGMTGALSTIHAKLPSAYFEVFGSPYTVDFTWYYIAILATLGMFTTIISPNSAVGYGSAKGEYEARFGAVTGMYMKRFCTVMWGVFGLAAAVLYMSSVNHPDLVWGHATRDLLGPLGLGLVGLMIACLTSALQSTVDCLMLTSAGLLTRNVYRPLMEHLRGAHVAQFSERHYIWVGRVLGTATVLGSVWIALQFDTILATLKFIWEMNVALIPAFWLGLKWRRANRIGAWISMLFGVAAFLVLPTLLPTVMPSLREHPALVKQTNPEPLVRTYTASEVDARLREAEIQRWEAAQAAGRSVGVKPERLAVGESFTRTYTLPRKGIFWTQDVKADEQGQLHGQGTLSLELVLLDAMGWDLSKNPYALNETIRVGIRLFSPILLMYLICLVTRPDDDDRLKRFYAVMRTPVIPDHAADAQELAKNQGDPERHRHVLLFPGSNWEFYRWTRQDYVGFVVCIAAVLVMLVFLNVCVSLGG